MRNALIAISALLALAACSTVSKIVSTVDSPAAIETACQVYATAKVGVAFVPVASGAAALIESAVDPVCADPAKFASTAAKTALWVAQNAAGLKAALKAEEAKLKAAGK